MMIRVARVRVVKGRALVTLGGSKKKFSLDVDLAQASAWQQQINVLPVGLDQTPLYELFVYEGFSMWCSVQFELFEELKLLTRYGELAAWLQDRQVGSVMWDACPDDAGRLLRQFGISVDSPGQAKRRFRSFLSSSGGVVARLTYFPLTALLWRMKSAQDHRSVIVYTPDILDKKLGCDFRFQKGYQFLRKNRIPFYEVFHTANAVRSLRSRIRFHRAAWSVETTIPLFVGASVDCSVFDDRNLPALVARWWRFRWRHFSARANAYGSSVKGIRRMIHDRGIRVLMGMEDFRSAPSLIFAARLEGIRVVLVLHGLITPYHLGWICPGIPHRMCPRPDRFLIHSPVWLDVLRKWKSHLLSSATIVAGWTAATKLKRATRTVRRGKRIVMFTHDTLWPDLNEIRAFVQRANEPGIEVWFTCRPDLSMERQVWNYFQNGKFRPARVVGDITEEVLESVDAIIGNHGSLLYHLSATGVPIIKTVTSYAFGDVLVESGIALPWAKEEMLSDVLDHMAKIPATEWSRRAMIYPGRGHSPSYEKVFSEEFARAGVRIRKRNARQRR